MVIAYIVGMEHGLNRYNYREISDLKSLGLDVVLFSTKHGYGPNMPDQDWLWYRYQPILVILMQPIYFIKSPRLYLELLWVSLRTGTLIELFLGFDFSRRMRKIGVNLIHATVGDRKLFIGYYCKRILQASLTVSLFGYELRKNPNWKMFQIAMRTCDAIRTNCTYNSDLLSDSLGPQCVPSKVIRHYSNTPANSSDNQIKILMVGAYVERKGHDILFRAIARMNTQNIQVWLAGFAGDLDVVRLAKDIGILDRVVSFGPVNDVVLDLLYKSCDIFVLPSITFNGVGEGLPVALIEAMAYGKPVIATRMTGVPELVKEILIEEGDDKGLADALDRLIRDKKLRTTMGLKNRQVIENEYSARNIDELYKLFMATNRQKDS